MGTRSLTKIYEQGVEVFCMYKQYDGYLEKPGLGSELKQLMQDYTENCSDYSAKAIKSLIHAVYMSDNAQNRDTKIEPIGTQNVGEEFTYKIYCDSSGVIPPIVTCADIYDSPPQLIWSDTSAWLDKVDWQR